MPYLGWWASTAGWWASTAGWWASTAGWWVSTGGLWVSRLHITPERLSRLLALRDAMRQPKSSSSTVRACGKQCAVRSPGLVGE